MGAVPKHKISSMRQGKRRAAIRLKPVQLSSCSKCGQAKLPHHACPACGAQS